MEIGDRIKQKRMELGLSQDELAEKIGYKSRSSINKIEQNLQRPKLSELSKLSKVLGVHMDYLVDGIVIEREEYQNISDKSHLFDYISKLHGKDTSYAVHLFSQLREFDRGKIIGMMEQMLNTYK